jgi:hypothetical protein
VLSAGLTEELSDHFRQAGDGRAPDVLGHMRDAGQCGVNAVPQLAEQARQQLVNPCTSRFRGDAVSAAAACDGEMNVLTWTSLFRVG